MPSEASVDPKEAVEVLRKKVADLRAEAFRIHRSASQLINDCEGADMAVTEAEEMDADASKLLDEADAIDAVLAELEQAQRERDHLKANNRYQAGYAAGERDSQQEAAELRVQIIKERNRAGEEIDRLQAEVERLTLREVDLEDAAVGLSNRAEAAEARVEKLVGALDKVLEHVREVRDDEPPERKIPIEWFSVGLIRELRRARDEAGGGERHE